MSRRQRGKPDNGSLFVRADRAFFTELFPLGTDYDTVNLYGQIATGRAKEHSVCGYMEFNKKAFLKSGNDFTSAGFDRAWKDLIRRDWCGYDSGYEIFFSAPMWKLWFENPKNTINNFKSLVRYLDFRIKNFQPDDDKPQIFPFKTLMIHDLESRWARCEVSDHWTADVQEILEDLVSATDPITYKKVNHRLEPPSRTTVAEPPLPNHRLEPPTRTEESEDQEVLEESEVLEGSISGEIKRADSQPGNPFDPEWKPEPKKPVKKPAKKAKPGAKKSGAGENFDFNSWTEGNTEKAKKKKPLSKGKTKTELSQIQTDGIRKLLAKAKAAGKKDGWNLILNYMEGPIRDQARKEFSKWTTGSKG